MADLVAFLRARLKEEAVNDEEANHLLAVLENEGFMSPYMARSRDYDNLEQLKLADYEAQRMNRESLRRALAGHDRQIKAEAWDACVDSIDHAATVFSDDLDEIRDRNPYRS
jgi:hypothetical protein